MALMFLIFAQMSLAKVVIVQNSRIEHKVNQFNEGLGAVEKSVGKAAGHLEVYTQELAQRLVGTAYAEKEIKKQLDEDFHCIKDALTKLVALAEDQTAKSGVQTSINVECAKKLPRSHQKAKEVYEEAMSKFPNTVMTTQEVASLLKVANYEFPYSTHQRKLRNLADDPLSDIKRVSAQKFLYRTHNA